MKEELFDEFLSSVKQGGAILRGEMQPSRKFQINDPEIQAIREKYGLSQNKFATLLGVSVGTLRNWEQGRRKPRGSSLMLLRVIAKHPEAVIDTLKS